MTSSCPACFATLFPESARFRCSSGRCVPVHDPEASVLAGSPVSLYPSYPWAPTEQQREIPPGVACARCGGPCTVQACPVCHKDLPPNWREATVFTMAVSGARGAGKSVYIAVLLYALQQYLRRCGRMIRPFTPMTQEVYEERYERPLFRENRAMLGTPPMKAESGAYQRDSMIWQISDPQHPVHLVIRDVAGEDIEKFAGNEAPLSYFSRANLVVFLFDSLRLPSMTQILAGIIPPVNQGRLGKSSTEVLPIVLGQLQGGGVDFALAFSKFDAFHELPKADIEQYARVMGNPSARFNRDETMMRPAGPGRAAESRSWFEQDQTFLDQEIRSLFELIHENTVTMQAEQALRSGRIRGLSHFAVSAVGETPPHDEQLTTRGISPFRVLDPLLWGLYRRGIML